jgi:hypothetical protein
LSTRTLGGIGRRCAGVGARAVADDDRVRDIARDKGCDDRAVPKLARAREGDVRVGELGRPLALGAARSAGVDQILEQKGLKDRRNGPHKGG